VTQQTAGRYFRDARPDVVAHLPASLGNVLELGCAEGEFGWTLLDRGLVESVIGVDAFVPTDSAGEKLTRFDRSDLDEWLGRSSTSFDTILALDVLEHLFDPWATVRQIAEHLEPGGMFVASIPNVRFTGVTAPLLVTGRFEYQKSGILDRTHLRFFTRRSVAELIRQAGLDLDRIVPIRHPLQRRSRRLAAAILRDHGVRQFLVIARRPRIAS
jgi:2-polyprenyl-3-methyl-5-hydroxy-6-metoxy-1,4-benzoquinol methylase